MKIVNFFRFTNLCKKILIWANFYIKIDIIISNPIEYTIYIFLLTRCEIKKSRFLSEGKVSVTYPIFKSVKMVRPYISFFAKKTSLFKKIKVYGLWLMCILLVNINFVWYLDVRQVLFFPMVHYFCYFFLVNLLSN